MTTANTDSAGVTAAASATDSDSATGGADGDGGCACASDRSGSAPITGLMLLLFAALRRRRPSPR
jgi:MYXO-CTERM domain-containing protein